MAIAIPVSVRIFWIRVTIVRLVVPNGGTRNDHSRRANWRDIHWRRAIRRGCSNSNSGQRWKRKTDSNANVDPGLG